MKVQLTKRLIESALPQPKPYELRDVQVRGLLLRVQPSGHKAWICEWTRGKRRTLGALGHLTLDQARGHATQTVAEYVQTGLPTIGKPKLSKCTLAGFLTDHYGPWAATELRSGQRSVQMITTAFADLLSKQLTDIDVACIDRWWRDRLTACSARSINPVTKTTLSRHVAALRAAFSKAVEWQLLDRNVLLGLRNKTIESRKVIRFLCPAEEARLRVAMTARDQSMVIARASGDRWRAERNQAALPLLPPGSYGDHITPVVLLAMNTGMRRGELLSLLWADIDFNSRIITVRPERAKNGKQRHLPINEEALAVLHQWQRQSGDCANVFKPNDIKTAWVKLLGRAKVKDFRFHDLRHTFASKLVTKGVDLNTVRELLGHGDIKMTLRYAHLGPSSLAAAVAKLGD